MQEPKNGVQTLSQDALLGGVVFGRSVHGLQVRVAEVTPQKVVQRIGEIGEAVFLHRLIDTCSSTTDATHHPPIDRWSLVQVNAGWRFRESIESTCGEPGRVPKFGAEISSGVKATGGVPGQRRLFAWGRQTRSVAVWADQSLSGIWTGLGGGGDQIASGGCDFFGRECGA